MKKKKLGGIQNVQNITSQKHYLDFFFSNLEIKTTVQPISTRRFSMARFRENSQIVVAMEEAMSTKHGSKIKFNVRHVVSFCGISVNALQPKSWDIRHEGVRF